MLDKTKPLLVEVTNAIFRALRLTQEEQKAVLHLIIDPSGMKLGTMKGYVVQRFNDYKILAGTLNKSRVDNSWEQKNETVAGAGLSAGGHESPEATSKEEETEPESEAENLRKQPVPKQPYCRY